MLVKLYPVVTQIHRLSEEIKDNEERLNALNKETEDLKLNLDRSEEIIQKKIKNSMTV